MISPDAQVCGAAGTASVEDALTIAHPLSESAANSDISRSTKKPRLNAATSHSTRCLLSGATVSSGWNVGKPSSSVPSSAAPSPRRPTAAFSFDDADISRGGATSVRGGRQTLGAVGQSGVHHREQGDARGIGPQGSRPDPDRLEAVSDKQLALERVPAAFGPDCQQDPSRGGRLEDGSRGFDRRSDPQGGARRPRTSCRDRPRPGP